jgi:insulysin
MVTRLVFFFYWMILIASSSLSAKDFSLVSLEKQALFKNRNRQESYQVLKDVSTAFETDSDRKVMKILLSNGLKVLLVSDPSLMESAAAISIESGTWDDPPEYQGMAHFVEHLLFLGTQAYPKESDYSQYILERGGQYNAFTRHDRTTYGFSIPHFGFEGALDRLSHFFIDPLFSASAIGRETHSVHHEFQDSIENDSLRVWRVLKESGNQKHPNLQFSCGNLESLAKIKRSDVVDWFETHYQPQRMRLVLASPLSMEALAELSSRLFSRILRKREEVARKSGYDTSLMSSQQKGHFIYIKPSFKNRSLFLTWEVPSDFLSHENDKAVHLVQMAIDHGFPNSLSRLLEKENLAMELHVDFWKIEKNHAIFMINIVLTNEGIKDYEKVISLVFQSINRLKELDFPEYLVKRLQYLNALQLAAPFEGSFEYVMKIASELIDEDIETYPDLTYLASPSTRAKASSFLRELSPFECVYCLMTLPEEVGIKLSRIERWMGSEYFMRKIGDNILAKWAQEKPHLAIGFQPEEEITIRRKDEAIHETKIEEIHMPDPLFIVDQANARIRLVETGVRENSVDAFFCMSTPLVGYSAKNTALNEIFIRGIDELLKLEFPQEDGIFWNLEIEGADLCVFLSVPCEDYTKHFCRFFNVLKYANISKGEFEKIKKVNLDSYPGDPQPIEYAHQILDSFLRPFHYTKMELYHNLSKINYEEYEQFREAYFEELFIEGAFLGFLGQKEALELWSEIYSILKANSYQNYKDRIKQFSFQDEAQSYFILQKTHRKGNALLLVIAGEEEGNETCHKIITTVLHNEFFEELRTKQQTAYRLYTWNEMIHHHICHCFALQSSSYHPLELLKRVEVFIDEFLERSRELLFEERFELIRDSLISGWEKQKGKIEDPEDIAFIDGELQLLRTLTYEDVLREIARVFSKDNRKRIAILVEGSQSHADFEQGEYGIAYLPIEKEHFQKN